MKANNQIAGKFDIVRTIRGAQVVIEHARPFAGQPEWLGMFGGINIETGHEVLVHGKEISGIVFRHESNADMDREYSEMASAKNHAFEQMRLEIV
jgi:hypothetical protein